MDCCGLWAGSNLNRCNHPPIKKGQTSWIGSSTAWLAEENEEYRPLVKSGSGSVSVSGSKGDNGKENLLDRIVAMLTKLGQWGYTVHEDTGAYRTNQIDTDTDTDPAPERKPRKRSRRAAITHDLCGPDCVRHSLLATADPRHTYAIPVRPAIPPNLPARRNARATLLSPATASLTHYVAVTPRIDSSTNAAMAARSAGRRTERVGSAASASRIG